MLLDIKNKIVRILQIFAKDPFIKYNNFDEWNEWSDKSENTPFAKDQKKTGVGNGEEKLAIELNLKNIGGQNSIADLNHWLLGHISVKDMTNDNCRLGVECTSHMRTLFRTIITHFINWSDKYKFKCELAKKFYDEINKKYGTSKYTILEGVDRCELSGSNLLKLNELLNSLKSIEVKEEYKKTYVSLKSEYIQDIISNLGNKSLQDLLNECVKREAIDMTLIIVHKTKGWLVVKDLSRLSCPRITQGSPRINYN